MFLCFTMYDYNCLTMTGMWYVPRPWCQCTETFGGALLSAVLQGTALKSVHAGSFTPIFLQKSCDMKLMSCFRMNCFDELSLLSRLDRRARISIGMYTCAQTCTVASSMWHHILYMSHIHPDWRISRSAQGAVISWRDIRHDSIVGQRRRGGRNVAQEKVQRGPFFSLFIHFL